MATVNSINKSQKYWHVRVRPSGAQLDIEGRAVLGDIQQLGLTHIEQVLSSKMYLLAGSLRDEDVRLLAEKLLADPVAERFWYGPGLFHRDDVHPAVEVQPLPGVMNPTAISTQRAAAELLDHEHGASKARIEAVQTARRFEIVGARTADELEQIASRVLANGCVETWYIRGFDRLDELPGEIPIPPQHRFDVRHVRLLELNEEELIRLSREGHLFLSLDEMRAIQDHFRRLERDPTDLEMETLAQTWSEHCVHKTLKSTVEYTGEDFGRPGTVHVRFENLLKETIVKATAMLDRDWCLSVFVDNAGVVAFDDEYGLAFKAETHNHPSAIEPYGGASTGIGGCIRDIMGCGLGAKPIASTDVFCLAPPDFDAARLPKDVIHPKRILRGVVRGVRDYGNRMGIPTVNGAIYFDERYVANPLVFCGCLGLIPRDRLAKEPKPGDRIVVAGGRTGRDGIHGATFSSAELTDTHANEFSHAVQIGNAIEEKKVLDALLIARDHPEGCLFSSVTDCGAGGLSSAVGEMGEQLGAVVDLETVPLKYAGLRYDEIWISEAQERMVFSVPPNKLDAFLNVFAAEDVEATVIGTFADDRVLRVRYDSTTVGELDMGFLHGGIPTRVRKATWTPGSTNDTDERFHQVHRPPTDPNDRLLYELGQWNTASKEWVIRQYDHEVQGRSVIKPLSGPGFGPSDASVLRPRYDSPRGVAIGCGLCPHRGDADPYWMAILAIDEALRNVLCVGANPNRTAILDNFCWPKTESEAAMGTLVRACRGAYDAAMAFGLPFVSGKDSLNNEFVMSEREARRTGLPSRIAIPPTLLISALSLVDDVSRCISMDLKQAGHCLVLASAPVDRVGLDEAKRMHDQVSELIVGGKVFAAHDVSDGGLAVAIAEMCFAGNLGVTANVDASYFSSGVFDEIATTYVLEMAEDDAKPTELPIIGRVQVEPVMQLIGPNADRIHLPIAQLAAAWRAPLHSGGGGV